MKTMTLEQLNHELDRLEAIQACRNLMGKYAYYHTASRNIDYMTLWAKREDDYFLFPLGEYLGYEGLYDCYVKGHGDRSDPAFAQRLQGKLVIHAMDTAVIEVADDLKTAKAVFRCPGEETKSGHGGCWNWGSYEVEFIQEDGQWKFWHMVLWPMFDTDFYQPWTAPRKMMPPPGGAGGPGGPGGPPKAMGTGRRSMWEWRPDEIFPADMPEPPTAYADYASMPHRIIKEDADL